MANLEQKKREGPLFRDMLHTPDRENILHDALTQALRQKPGDLTFGQYQQNIARYVQESFLRHTIPWIHTEGLFRELNKFNTVQLWDTVLGAVQKLHPASITALQRETKAQTLWDQARSISLPNQLFVDPAIAYLGTSTLVGARFSMLVSQPDHPANQKAYAAANTWSIQWKKPAGSVDEFLSRYQRLFAGEKQNTHAVTLLLQHHAFDNEYFERDTQAFHHFSCKGIPMLNTLFHAYHDLLEEKHYRTNLAERICLPQYWPAATDGA